MTNAFWWDPTRHADRRPLLITRNRIQTRLRLWFDEQGFTEVDPAALAVSPGNEAHLHAFATEAISLTGESETRYLHTSPEFAMKKLLAAGETRIAAFAHVWRNREGGPRHASEFTMLEWYRAHEDYTVLMDDTAAFIRIAAEVAGADVLRHGKAECDPKAPYQRVSVAEAFLKWAGIDLLATIRPDGSTDRRHLADQMGQIGMTAWRDDTWADLFSAVLVAKIEPRLGMGQITILDRYPAAEAALARRCADDPRVSERFEVYACGVELANGFGELTDPVEQRARFIAEMDEKERIYDERYPLDEDLLAALPLVPPTSGIALGFDRLVMLATGAPRLSDVQWTPPLG